MFEYEKRVEIEMVNDYKISTKRITTSCFKSLNTKKTMAHDNRSLGPDLVQAQKLVTS